MVPCRSNVGRKVSLPPSVRSILSSCVHGRIGNHRFNSLPSCKNDVVFAYRREESFAVFCVFDRFDSCPVLVLRGVIRKDFNLQDLHVLVEGKSVFRLPLSYEKKKKTALFASCNTPKTNLMSHIRNSLIFLMIQVP